MSKILFGYWDARGFGEPIRHLLHYANVDFEDKRYSLVTTPFSSVEWNDDKFNLGLDFPNLPYLFDGDVKLTQSMAILRYLARKFKLDGETEEEKIRLDLAEQELCDFRLRLVRVAYADRKDYEKVKNEYLKELPAKFELLSKFLGNKMFVIGDKVKYVDFLLYEVLDFHKILKSSCLNEFENLQSYLLRFECLPAIKKYMNSGTFKRLPINALYANFGGNRE
ncbi:Glutathione S-transferase Mu 1-like protein [Leptotrombidium deliense]|uniref:glutathione transferase n=1 Tax=Leptotrombidium deliense TaxID=299467 RepID=A0A443RVV4_9ACAR|nr:Glutathione S-transferase Mu 1-like protein [Leptotrombidium deliense]